MKVKTLLVIRYTILQIVFIFITLPFMILPTRYIIKFLYPVFSWLFKLAPKIRVDNLSRHPLEIGEPVIYASNHKCFADFSLITTFLREPFAIMVKEEMTRIPVFNLIARKMKLIPVLRGNHLSQFKAVEKAKKVLIKDKFSIIMFPEGIYVNNKPVGHIKSGIAKIAKEANARVIPIAIYGINNSFIDEKKLVWKNAYIKAGKRLDYNDFRDKDRFTRQIEKSITILYHEIEREIKRSHGKLLDPA